VVGLDVDGDSNGKEVVGTGVWSGGVGPKIGESVGFADRSTRQPHGFEIASASSCAPTHSDCVSSEFNPARSTSRHCMPAMNPLAVASRPDKHNTQKTFCTSGSIMLVGAAVPMMAGAGAGAGGNVGLLLPGGQPHLSPTSARAWTVAHCSVVYPLESLPN